MTLSPDDEPHPDSPTDHLRRYRKRIESIQHTDRVDVSAELEYHLDAAVANIDAAIDHLERDDE